LRELDDTLIRIGDRSISTSIKKRQSTPLVLQAPQALVDCFKQPI